MKIAVFMVAYNEVQLVLDHIDAIKMWITEDITLVVDAAGWDNFKDFTYPGVNVVQGYYHGHSKSPYKNVTLALKTSRESFPDADWYWYIEPDVLVTSNTYKKELQELSHNWLLGVDYRRLSGCKLTNLTDMIGVEPQNNFHNMLGCSMTFNKCYLEKLEELDFFTKFLEYCEDLGGPRFPNFTAYAFEETLFPSMAIWLGGGVHGLATSQNWGKPSGLHAKYHLRFCGQILPEYLSPSVCMVHPLKEYDHPIRVFYRQQRERIQRCTMPSM